WIALNYPIAAFARPGEQLRAGLSPMARRFAHRRVNPSAARLLGRGGEARWTLLTGPMSTASSTEIRRRGFWPWAGRLRLARASATWDRGAAIARRGHAHRMSPADQPRRRHARFRAGLPRCGRCAAPGP